MLFRNDLDLHCRCPGGAEIYFLNKRAEGGILDVDRRESCDFCVENIYFADPKNGEYNVIPWPLHVLGALSEHASFTFDTFTAVFLSNLDLGEKLF